MSGRKKTCERGEFKRLITSALFKNAALKDLLIGDLDGMSKEQIMTKFQKHVKSHLFIDDTITDTSTYIFYDITFPYIHENVKTCNIVMYAICHRDILEDYFSEEFFGNRADILAQLVEDTILNDDDLVYKFGIGKLQLFNSMIYNSADFYGHILTFTVPNFR